MAMEALQPNSAARMSTAGNQDASIMTKSSENTMIGAPEAPVTNPASAPFACTWPNCNEPPFARKSGLKKHMDKHTKPYICNQSPCHNLKFSDKAGLHRHEAERHGDTKYFCTFDGCRRKTKGFARRRNRDSHLVAVHGRGAGGSGAAVEEAGEISEGELDDSPREEMKGLRAMLQEREDERERLMARQGMLDEEIRNLKGALQLVSA